MQGWTRLPNMLLRIASNGFIVLLLTITATGNDNWINYRAGGNQINAIIQEESLLWIGTDNGLVCLNMLNQDMDHYDEISGLPYAGITSIVIDSAGSKWIGTGSLLGGGGGLVRYDGDSWQVFDISNSDLPSNYIQMLYVDSSNNLWIGCGSSIPQFGGSLLKFDGNSWTVYNHNNSGLPDTYINAMVEDSIGNYWICTEDGLVKFDGNIWEVFTPANSDILSIHVLSIEIDDHKKWLGLYGGLTCYNDTSWTTYTPQNSPLPHHAVKNVAFDQQNNLWIGTWNGLACFDGTNWKVFDEENTGLLTDDITALLIDEADNKWVGTFNYYNDYGLRKYNDSELICYNTAPTLLRTNDINQIQVDNTNAKWICTQNGLVKYQGDSWILFDSSNSDLPYNNIQDIDFDADGNIWACVLGDCPIGSPAVGALTMFNGTNWVSYNSSNSGLPSNQITEVSIGDNGIIWIVAGGNSLVRFDGHNWDIFNSNNSVLPCTYINNINTIGSVVWLSTDNGLYKYDGLQWSVYNQSNSPLPSNVIRNTAFDDDTLWICTDAGLVKYDSINWNVYNSDNSGLPNDNLISLHVQNGIKWIGGFGTGLVAYDNISWDVYNTDITPILDNTITSITTDNYGNLWIVCDDSGISEFNSNGIVVNVVPEPSSLIPKNHKLFPNYPNPFNPSTTIQYELPEHSTVSLDIYDIQGHNIQTLVSESKPAGHYEAQWNGTDRDGKQVAAGMYFARLQVVDPATSGAGAPHSNGVHYSSVVKMVYLR